MDDARAIVSNKDRSPSTTPEALLLGRLSAVGGAADSQLGAAIIELGERARRAAAADDAERRPLTFAAYQNAVRKADSMRVTLKRAAAMGKPVFLPDDSPTMRRFLRMYRAEYSPDVPGYARYLGELNEVLTAAVFKLVAGSHVELREHDRRAHTLITGASRSGKSELMKRLVHHYVAHPGCGVLVVDPHGEMASQIARWREFSGAGVERLVYLDATASPEIGMRVPALNPLSCALSGDDELSQLADHLASALAFFGGDGEGHTAQMHRLGKFMLRILLGVPGSTLMDMMAGLASSGRRDRKPAPQWVEAARNHHDELVSDFFRSDFDGESYASTRDALKRRLSHPLEVPVFRRMMTAPNPINLEALLNAGKVVVVNCASAGSAASVLGRFIMAQVAALGERRLANPYAPRPPVHVFVDEATQLMAPPFVNILERFAKTGIWLTMAQQGAGEGGEREIVGRVKRSTFLKFVGRSGSQGEMAHLLGIPRKELPQLAQGQFVVTRTGEERAPLLLDTRPSPVVGFSGSMNGHDWQAALEYQLATYYRAAAPPALPSPAASPPASRWRE